MFPLLETPAPCPGCGNAAVRPLHVFRNIKPVVQTPFLGLFGCPRCGLVYSSPRATERELARYYDPDVEGGWEKGRAFDDPSNADRVDKWLANKRGSAQRQLRAAASVVPLPDHAGRHAFDFGCGPGAFLDVLQDQGWKTTGLEPAHLRELAGRRHAIVDRIPDAATFDLVNVHHVLEHLLEPAQALEALARASRPNAVLLCSVPALDSLPRHGDFRYISNPLHINSFTTASLTCLLQRSGWRPLRVVSGGFMPEPTKDDRERIMAVAIRDDRAPALPMPAEPLSVAEEALRAYGRTLGVDGKPRVESVVTR